MVLTLYKLEASPPVRAVLMTIEALKLEGVQYVDLNVEEEQLKDGYLKMEPQETVPMLTDDDSTVMDSWAIASYLVDKYGTDDSLYPKNSEERELIDSGMGIDSGILKPALRDAIVPALFGDEKAYVPDTLENITNAYTMIEESLTADWMAGDHVTIADFCYVSSISTMNEVLPIDGNEFPNLKAWLKRCSDLEVYKKANLPGLEEMKGLLKAKLA